MIHSTHTDWEKSALRELYKDYIQIVQERKLTLRRVAIVLVDSDSTWGAWHPETRTIAISKKLILNHSWFYVTCILKHEMAHQLLDETRSEAITERELPHGREFYLACQKLGLPEEFTKATINLQSSNLDWRQNTQSEISNRMMDKVRKLLSLATSSNEHEALLAMNKVREIYAKYNLEEAVRAEKLNFVHITINLGKKRIEAHVSRMISILVEHFFVEAITMKLFDAVSGNHLAAFEIIGTRENSLMAEYVYFFLQRETEQLVKQLAKKNPLSRIQRKSYRLGILAGFSEKLTATETKKNVTMSDSEIESRALISKALANFKEDPILDEYLSHIYPRVSRRRTGSQYVDNSTFAQGKSAGGKICFNRPITGAAEKTGKFLSRNS